MSIIGVRKIPPRLTLPKLIRKLAHVINGQFEAFFATHNTSNSRTCYLNLAPNLDQFNIINNINNARFPYPLEAFLPDNYSHIQIPSGTKKIPHSLRKVLKIPPNFTPNEMLKITQEQIMTEMLSKFIKLYDLSSTTNHMLLQSLWQIINQRLQEVHGQKNCESCFTLSKYYRYCYPHNSDFKLITDVMIDSHNKMEIPYKDLDEAEFCEYNPENHGCYPDSLLNIRNKYSDKIVSKIMNHIKKFNTDNNEGLATAKVRQHITNLSHLIPSIVRTIIKDKFNKNTHKPTFEVVRVYGEPFLPSKKIMSPFLKKFSLISMQRSERIYNLITVKIPATNLLKILKYNGTSNFGTKFVIRPLNAKKHITTLKEIQTMMTPDNQQ